MENWDYGSIVDAGSITWRNGTTGRVGVASDANSLVGSQDSDQVGNYGAGALDDGNYVVRSPFWHNGGTSYAGAITLGWGIGGTTGAITFQNSVLGFVTYAGETLTFTHNEVNSYLAVGKPAENLVTLFYISSYYVFLPSVQQ